MSGHFAAAAIVGIAWYRRGDWPELRALFTDADKLPLTWEDWEQRATALERSLVTQGKRVVRSEIRPRPFAEWCTRTGRQPDAQARMAWSNERTMAALGHRD